MTVSAQLDSIASIPAFKSCSEATLQRLKDEGSVVRFNIGHSLIREWPMLKRTTLPSSLSRCSVASEQLLKAGMLAMLSSWAETVMQALFRHLK